MKRCARCKKRKPLTEYSKQTAAKDGLQGYCKTCMGRGRRARYDPVAGPKAAAEWRQKNLERSRKVGREYKRALRLDALLAYSGGVLECACCGEKEPRFLTLDHTEGGGNEHRRKFTSMSGIYSWLKKKKYPAGFQVLCYNCNCGKGANGLCPHQEAST